MQGILSLIEGLQQRLEPFMESGTWVFVFIAVFVGFYLAMLALERKDESKNAIADRQADEQHFTLRYSKFVTKSKLVYAIFIAALLFFFLLVGFQSLSNLVVYFLIGLVATIWLFIESLRTKNWEIVVNGDEIRVKTLFKDETFSFHEIDSVIGRFPGTSKREIQMVLYSGAERLFYINRGVIGYTVFVRRLEARGVEGVKLLNHEFFY